MAGNIWEMRLSEDPRRSGEVRSEWERDYARLIHSSAFRRLQSKTQVLGLGVGADAELTQLPRFY